MLDAQSLRIDLLVAARDDIRGTYDTYVCRLDTLLLLNTLIFPFALNTLQFSEEFVPRTEIDCADCLEASQVWLGYIWVGMVAVSLVLPFWSILLLLKSKSYLDRWLEFTLSHLHHERRSMLTQQLSSADDNQQPNRGDSSNGDVHAETGQHMLRLSVFLVESQERFCDLWSVQVCPLVTYSNYMLWSSAYMAVALVALMFWIFLFNRKGNQQAEHVLFGLLVIVGLLAPVFWLVRERLQGYASPPNLDQGFDSCTAAGSVITGSPTCQRTPPSQRYGSNPGSSSASPSQPPHMHEESPSRGQKRWMTVRHAVRAGAVRADSQQGLLSQTQRTTADETVAQSDAMDHELDAPRRFLSQLSNRRAAQSAPQ